MFKRNDELKIDEIKRGKEIFSPIIHMNFNCKFLSQCVKYPHSLSIRTCFPIFNRRLERLNLELFCSGCWYLDIIIFVEKKRNVVIISPLHLFPSVYFDNLLFLRIEVDAIT